MALLEANRNRGSETGISQWVFDDTVGRISARDTYGNLVMALAAGPLFGQRLAAAFNSSGAVVSYGEELRPAGLQQFLSPRQ